jgi:steroid 5-alpha reductase family enzyme
MELWYALGLSLFINIAMFLVAFKQQTDKLTDISYAVTFVVLVTYAAVSTNEMDTPKWILLSMVLLWALRIGGYLFLRINKMGRDKRFDNKRSHFFRFLGFWLLQAVTVWVVMLGAIEFYAESIKPISGFMVSGVTIWAVGLVVEAVADRQKFQFFQDKSNKNKWIASGLWKYSRHPNYFGEILVWFGVYVFVVSGLDGSAQYIAMASPLFITFLLLFVSGVPLLEKSADKKWGKDKKYLEYKKSTSVVVPFPPKS